MLRCDVKDFRTIWQAKWDALFGFLAVFMLLLGLSFGPSATAAPKGTPIPEEMLSLDQQRCLMGCLAGFDEKTCNFLCACSLEAFRAKLDFERYLDLSAALAQDKINTKQRQFLDDVAKDCAAALDAQEAFEKSEIEQNQQAKPQP